MSCPSLRVHSQYFFTVGSFGRGAARSTKAQASVQTVSTLSFQRASWFVCNISWSWFGPNRSVLTYLYDTVVIVSCPKSSKSIRYLKSSLLAFVLRIFEYGSFISSFLKDELNIKLESVDFYFPDIGWARRIDLSLYRNVQWWPALLSNTPTRLPTCPQKYWHQAADEGN